MATGAIKALRISTHLLQRMEKIREWQSQNSRWAPNGNLTETAQIRLLLECGLSHFEQMRSAVQQQQSTDGVPAAVLGWRN